jgi:dipeptidyl-peptidase-4
MRLFFLLLLAMVTIPAGLAADAPLFNPQYLRDHAETRGFNLGRPTHAHPTPDGKAVLFLRARARSPELELYEFDTVSGSTRLLLTPQDLLKGAAENLSPEEKALRERMRISVGGFTSFELSKDGRAILLSLSGKLYIVERANRSVRELKTSSGSIVDPKFSPDGRFVSYVLGHDVCIYDLGAGTERHVTEGGTELLSHGLAEFVASEEMLRYSGYWWSPDSTALVYEESDARGVEVWYVADPAKPGDPPYPSRYPRPGKANVSVRLGVVPIRGGETVWLQWDREKYPYLTTVHWDEYGPLTVAVQTRDQKELLLLQADDHTGTTRSLLTERDPAWVNIRQDVPRWLAGGRGFIWASDRPGADWQLEWRGSDGTLQRVLVPSDAGFRALIDADPDTGELLISRRTEPPQWTLERVDLKGDIVPVKTSPGCHAGATDEHHSIFVDTASDLSHMSLTTVYRRDGTLIGELPSVAEPPPFTPRVELVKVGAAPGFYTALVRPHDFDAQKRYPVIVEVYGGPLPPWSSGTVVASMGSWLLPQWIANQGFIVVSIDGRGTPGRGHDWERAIEKRFGSLPLEDQVTALKALGARFPELDLERVGMYGWSFGGYMSALAVLKGPDVFKAAVAGAPPTDWLDYDTHYTERYLGIPPADAAAYHDASLLPYASQLRRPLLLIHGTGDDNVYFRNTLKLVDALFRAGKVCEVLPLSGLTHMVPDPVVNEQLYSRLVRFFQAHLTSP